MHKKPLFILIIIAIVAFYVSQILFPVQAYLPHERIVISVPFEKTDPPDSLIPMGETIYHPKPKVPNGHPGIDFSWPKGHVARIRSSSDGVITSIKQGASEGDLWDIEVKSGVYLLRYKELATYNTSLKTGSYVRKGDYIGSPGTLANGFHWELASINTMLDRFCPLTYLDSDSLTLINKIWNNTPNDQMKQQFPYICSGDYYNKIENK